MRGALSINDAPDLTHLSGSGKLREVGGDFRLDDAVHLREVQAFDELREIGGSAVVSDNERLVYLGGLTMLASIGRASTLSSNSLRTLDELAQLTTVGGDLRITSNFSLSPADAHALLDRLVANGFSGQATIFRNGDVDDGHD